MVFFGILTTVNLNLPLYAKSTTKNMRNAFSVNLHLKKLIGTQKNIYSK